MDQTQKLSYPTQKVFIQAISNADLGPPGGGQQYLSIWQGGRWPDFPPDDTVLVDPGQSNWTAESIFDMETYGRDSLGRDIVGFRSVKNTRYWMIEPRSDYPHIKAAANQRDPRTVFIKDETADGITLASWDSSRLLGFRRDKSGLLYVLVELFIDDPDAALFKITPVPF